MGRGLKKSEYSLLARLARRTVRALVYARQGRDIVNKTCDGSAIYLDRGAHQSPMGPVGDGHHHLQIAQEFGNGGGRRMGLALPLRFEKQLGLFENPLPDRRR